MRILVTGGAGFIGSAVIRHLIHNTAAEVANLDRLTYAGNLASLEAVANSPRHRLHRIDICDGPAVAHLFATFRPTQVMHLAAESHVDRSIDGPATFIQTNLVGTFSLLEAARHYWNTLDGDERKVFRFHHVSTDEVYGDLGHSQTLFTERSAYAPSSPYAASKAGADHLVRAWHHTYGLPAVLSNCSNNYGPHQFPEKLIPHVILNALAGQSLPVYGDGSQVRDWLHVEDHARALVEVMTRGVAGETYNIGGHNQQRNLDVVEQICDLLDAFSAQGKCQRDPELASFRQLITFVSDRPGHDRRYAVDASKIHRELGWMPQESFESGLRRTVLWYLDNPGWWQPILDGEYQLERLGDDA